MRKHLIALAVCAGATAAVAASDRLDARPSTPAALPADSLVTMYEVGGVPVIHRRTSSEIVALEVYLLGGSRQVTAATAGIEPLMVMASESGTKGYPGSAAREAIARTGSNVGVSTSPDYTSIGFIGLAEDFDSTFSVIADRLVNPTLDSASVAIAKQRLTALAQARLDGADGMARAMAESLAYAGHPYANRTAGTPASIASITPAAVREYHKSQLMTSRLVLVVAGNVSRQQVEGIVQKSLGTLPKGDYKWSLPEPWTPKAPAVAVKSQRLPTNYIFAMFGGPQTSHKDGLALSSGLSFLAGQIVGPMRDSGLTYSADAGFIDQGAAGGYITLSTGSPDRAMRIINDNIEFLSRELRLPPGSMPGARMSQDQYALAMETSAAQVSRLADSYIYHGDYRYFENFSKELRQVTLEDITRSLRTYVKNVQYAYVGDTTKLPRAMMLKY